MLRKAERDHYELLLKGCQNNLSKSWKIIEQDKSNKFSSKFVINNKYVSDPNIIANAFNKLSNIGQILSRNIPCVNRGVCSFIKSSNSNNSIFIAPAYHEEVIKVVKRLNNSAPGYDSITSDINEYNQNQI